MVESSSGKEVDVIGIPEPFVFFGLVSFFWVFRLEFPRIPAEQLSLRFGIQIERSF